MSTRGLSNPKKGNYKYKIYNVREELLRVTPYPSLALEFASEYLGEDIQRFQEGVLLRGHLFIRVERD